MKHKFIDCWLFNALPSVRRLTYKDCLYIPVFLASVWWAEGIQAKEFYIQPSINITTKYDDNIRLMTKDRADLLDGFDTSAYGVITRAAAKLGVRSDRYDLLLDSQVVINRYSSDFDLDSEDVFVNFTSNFNATEKNILSLSGNYTRDTALTSELDESGTGLVEDNPIREQWSVSPNWTYLLSETQFLQANYSHYDVSYDESKSNNFSDYTTDRIVLTYSKQWLPVLRNFYNISVMYFEVPESKIGLSDIDIKRETLEYSVDVGVEYQISPTWFASLTVGGRFNQTDITIEKDKNSDDVLGMIFSFNIDKQFETGNAGINYSRSTNPRGDGRLQLLDRFDANFSHRFTHNLHFSLTGGVSVSSNSGSEDEGNDRTNYRVRPAISWFFNRNTRLTGGYQYRRQEFERHDEVAESNSFFLNFNYQWDMLATQRY
jgi:hypothetical protein